MQGNHKLFEIFVTFLKLGLTSFGGPIAHLGYFRKELVQRRQWVSDETYAQILALSQFLPGPASSQTAFALGWQRGGPAGAMMATLGFTLPSAVIMIALAAWIGTAPPGPGWAGGLIAGLKITAVAVVADAVWGMAGKLTPDLPRRAIALLAVLILALMPFGAVAQVCAILAGAGIALIARIGNAHDSAAVTLRGPTKGVALGCLALFTILLLGLPLLAQAEGLAQIADVFYRAGALVFGGGHVVLPLLDAGVVGPGLVSKDSFLAGYGAAQAMPGPLFTFAGWLGQVAEGFPGAITALIAIFLPGFLLMAAALPFWSQLSALPAARHAMAGANAAVVGLLAYALYDPVYTGAIRGAADLALAVALFVMLRPARRPAWQVVIAGGIGGIALAVL